MSDPETISTSDAPAALGPYSQGVVHDGVLYCSGTLAVDPATGDLITTSAAAEVTRCLENLSAVCRAAGTDLSGALRLTVYTTDLASFAEINEAYSRFFSDRLPARVTIGVAALPMGARVEVDAFVAMP